MNWLVYKHVSPSHKVYIGITHLLPSQRWCRGNGYKNNPVFYKAIKKYGWDNIEHKIVISNLTKEQAEEVEKQLISYYKNIGLSYNITNGGEGTNGYKHTDEYKERMKILQLGKPKNPLSIQKQKETKTLYPYHHTDDAKRKIAEASRLADHSKAAMFAKIANSRSVVLRTVDGEIREFNSQREAAKFLKVSEWKVSVSTKEHRFVKEVRGYLEAKLK